MLRCRRVPGVGISKSVFLCVEASTGAIREACESFATPYGGSRLQALMVGVVGIIKTPMRASAGPSRRALEWCVTTHHIPCLVKPYDTNAQTF